MLADRPGWRRFATYAPASPGQRFDRPPAIVTVAPPQRSLDVVVELVLGERLEAVADQTLFGSDWPGPMVPDIGENVAEVRSLDLPDEAVDRILYGTAAELFDLE